MGRPTMEGYWNSGKFYSSTAISPCSRIAGRRGGAYLRGIANFEEAGSSIEDCRIDVSRYTRELEQYTIPIGGSDIFADGRELEGCGR